MTVIDRVVNIIRDRKAIIFSGAGMSYYSGCSTGSFLANELLKTFEKKDKDKFKNSALPEISQHYVNIRNGKRSELIRLLKKHYKKHYETIEYHQKLSQIPQIKNIITTNYDYLFEKAYGERLEVIFDDHDIPSTSSERDRVNLYKLHGDFEHSDKIILTSSDFTSFYKKIKTKILWSHLVSLIASNSVIFIGYGLEEDHIDEILKFVFSKLGNFQNECFFVSRTISDDKRVLLLEKNITSIETTAEEFIKSIYAGIQRNLISDIISNKVDNYTVKPIFEASKINPIFEIDNYKMKSIKLFSKTRSQITKPNRKLFESLKSSTNEADLCLIEIDHEDLKGEFAFSTKRVKELNEFIQGESLDEFIINSDELDKFTASINELQVIDFKKGDSKNLIIKHNPTKILNGFLTNKDCGRFENVVFEIYRFKHILHIICIHDQFTIHHKIKFAEDNTISGNIEFEFRIKNSSFGIRFFKYLLSHNILEIPSRNGLLKLADLSIDTKTTEFLENMLDIYRKINFIEDKISRRFEHKTSFFEITQNDVKIINNIYMILKDHRIQSNQIKSIIFIKSEKNILRVLDKTPTDIIFKPQDIKEFNFELFGKIIVITIDSFELLDATIKNKDELLTSIKNNQKESNVVIESKENIVANYKQIKIKE